MVLTPEHFHLILNHVPLVGFAGLIVLLVYGLVRNEPHTIGIALAGAAVLAIVTSIVMWTGEQAHGRFMFESVSQFLDDTGPKWIEEHEHRAEYASIAAYVTGGLGAVGLLALWLKPAWRRTVAAIVLVGALATSGLTAYTALAGGKIHHPELRPSPDAAPAESGEHEHEHEHEDDS